MGVQNNLDRENSIHKGPESGGQVMLMELIEN